MAVMDEDDRIDEIFKDLQRPRKRLTPWELDFLESVSDQWGRRRSLSDKQRMTLVRIYEEKC